jgi:hypothetical protein
VTSNPSVRTAGDLAPRKLGHGLAIEIRIQGPGHLVAQWLGEEIELRAGTLRHVTGFLRLPVFRKLIDETSQYLVPAPVSSGQAEIKQIFRFVLSRMIRQTMNRRHGGCFVILPDRDYAADIAVGYRCENSVSLVRSVQEFWDANRTAGNTLAPSPPEDANRMAEWAWQKLLAIGDTIDRASCVDGCVVLTRDLRLRGFGGHIAIRDDDPDLLRRPLRDEVTRDVLADVTGGTRHRSALRLCRKIAGAMALVISQDGYLTAYWSDDDAAHCVGNLAAADPFDG